jgi:hypothetical protein
MSKPYANMYSYSDVHPCEVVREVSEKTLEVRAMSAERCPTWKPEFVAGGFAGHCVNNIDQRWVYASRPDAPVFRIRWTKRGWRDAHGGQYHLSESPRRFHDYNF